MHDSLIAFYSCAFKEMNFFYCISFAGFKRSVTRKTETKRNDINTRTKGSYENVPTLITKVIHEKDRLVGRRQISQLEKKYLVRRSNH